MTDETEAITKVERYHRICSQIDRFADRAGRSFTAFVQLSVAIVGGFIWLKTQDNLEQAAGVLPLARWLLPALSVIVIIEMWSDHVSWRGFRIAEAKILERPDLMPRLAVSGRLEFFRMAIALVVGIAGYIWLR